MKSNQIKKYVVIILLMILWPKAGHGLMFKKIEVSCPLCGTTFETSQAISGTAWGSRLDFRPLGPIASPWPIPVCPNCRFVIFKDKFNKEEVERLRLYVKSQEYQNLAKNHPSYYLLAKIYEFNGMGHLILAHTYLKASWQVEASDHEKCTKYLEMSLKNFEKYLLTNDKRDDRWVNAELLCGEIERRLGHFEKAKNRFDRLESLQEFRKDNLRRIIFTQIYLIGIEESRPREFPLREIR